MKPNSNTLSFKKDQQRIMINLPFCPQNEIFAKTFIQRLKVFTQNKHQFVIIWKTRKIRSLFPLKDKINIKFVSDVIYGGLCLCKENYIGETDRNSSVRWKEHEDIKKTSEPAKHLKACQTHKFEWSIICKASANKTKRKILEAFLIKTQNPSLNINIDNFQLKLFRNGVT